MAKSAFDRVYQTVDCEWPMDVFQGHDVQVVKDILEGVINDHLSQEEFLAISEMMSLGGLRIIKRQATTDLRHLKRLAVLFHHVLGYHTSSETLQFRNTIEQFNKDQMTVVARNQVVRALQMVRDPQLWARQITPRYGGRLVHYYNQADDPRLDAMEMTENGWCLGMSVQWLADKKNKVDFWSRHGTPEQAGRYRFVMAGQRMRIAGLGGSNTSDRAAFRLRREGMSMVGETRETADTSSARLAEMIATNPTSYARIGQYYVDGGGHAMAAYVHGGAIHFMDPNRGEFYFANSGQFRIWFRLFCRQIDYRFNEFYIEAFRENRAPMDTGLAAALGARRRAMGYED